MGSDEMKTLIRGDIVTPSRLIPGGFVLIEGKEIKSVGVKEPESYDILLDFESCYIAPGFVDIHIHGGRGHESMDPRGLGGVSKFLAEGGVTSFLPTTTTAPLEDTLKAIEKIGKRIEQGIKEGTGGATPLGIHMEGPYISLERCGAQNRVHVRLPDIDELEQIYKVSAGWIKIITLAPEVEGALEAVNWLSTRGVLPAAGHTNATFDEMAAGIEAGVRHASHLFNAMKVFHHREPGAAGAALVDDRVTVELIADGAHLHPAILRLAANAKGTCMTALVSDCIAPAGLPEGEYEFGGLKVTVRQGKSHLKSGRLAGSTIRLCNAVENMVRLASFTVPEAVKMATSSPARIVGISDKKGRLAPGMDADVAVLDRDFSVLLTVVGGNVVFKRDEY
jgi:N-acetylglucosamine-6-phosphate deacetylase